LKTWLNDVSDKAIGFINVNIYGFALFNQRKAIEASLFCTVLLSNELRGLGKSTGA